MSNTIKNVSIGNTFQYNKNCIAKVVDIGEVISMRTGEIIGHICYAKTIDTMAQNVFEVPFSTVARNKL